MSTGAYQTPSPPKELGAQALQYLESLQGFQISLEEATHEWDKLSEAEKRFMVSLYRQFVLED